MPEKPFIFVVSDSVGETADLVTRAALSQFDGTSMEIRRYHGVNDRQKVQEVVTAARERTTLIVFTIIVPEALEEMKRLTTEYDILAVDIMSPMLEGMERVLGVSPHLKAGLVHRLDEGYFQRVEAVEFAVKYDDGKDPRGFLRADVVLLGVSRTSKTPVSMYLAHRKIKVANLPLVPEAQLPRELFMVPPQKVVGLRVSPEKLHDIREERMKTMGLRSNANYANMERILMELDYAEDVFKTVGCPVVEVTNMAVEETAIRVLEMIQKGENVRG